MKKDDIPDFAVIVPVYCNQDSLDELVFRIQNKIFKDSKLNGIIVFCDDGSTDNSFEKLKNIIKNNQKVNLIKLTKNFGQISAIYASLETIKAKSYIIMSADLQDPVELINDFLFHHFKDGYEIVGGERVSREDGLLSKFAPRIFFKLLSKLSFPNYPLGGFDFFLISQKIRNIMLKSKQADPFLQGEVLLSGYPSKFIPYSRMKRPFGSSKWSFSKKVKYFIDAIMGYSYFPLRLMSVFGVFLFFSSFSFLIYIFASKILGFGEMPIGWASLMVVVLFLGAIQMIFLGVLGEYVWRILSQVRNKPNYIIEETM